MHKILVAAFISIGLVSSVKSGTGLNCYEVMEMEANESEICFDQTNEWLNGSYQELLKSRKDDSAQVKLLREMQRSWIKLRDAQCEFASRNTGSNAALTGLTCEVVLTQRRADQLEKMLKAEFF